MAEDKVVLVTGGAGYLGCHLLVELSRAGFTPVVLDNLPDSSMESIRKVEDIIGKPIQTYTANLLDKRALSDVFSKLKVSVVVHLAGVKKVGESCQKPLLYYQVNVTGTLTLLEVMQEHGVKRMVFASSATVYGPPQYLPMDEKHPAGHNLSPYGMSKYMAERVLNDVAKSDPHWSIVVMRIFNPAGSHPSSQMRRDSRGSQPDNLLPLISQAALGWRPRVTVFGKDFDTEDGTGVRDFVHVVDLAQGMVASVRKAVESEGCRTYNMGSGQGFSVLEMISTFEKVSGKKIPYTVVERRSGDVGSCYADVSKAERELGWKAKAGLGQMCEDLWRWQLQSKEGEED